MLAATPITSAERPESTTRAPQRAALAAAEPGPRFADLLQRGQATHGVLARPAQPNPTQAEKQPAAQPQPKPQDNARGNADGAAPTPAQPTTRAAAQKAGAKPAPHPREKAEPSITASGGSNSPATGAMLARDESAGAVPIDPLLAADLRAPLPTPSIPTTPGSASPAGSVACPAVEVAGQAPAPELRGWPAGLKLPGLASAEPADGADGVDAAAPMPAADAGGAAGLGNGDTKASNARLGAGPGADPTHEARADAAAPDGTRAAGLAALPALAADERGPARLEAHPETPALHDAAQGLLPGVGGAAPRGVDAATLAPIALPAPLHSPEFAQALGAQVSVLARDGVQRAELHLNPAEMGPISVQIEIDGKAARVDFAAGAAATREVIERGLPELASALREQGLTLAGGGVFQQAPDRRDRPEPEPGGNAGRARRRGALEGPTPPRAIAVPLPQGTLDLYA